MSLSCFIRAGTFVFEALRDVTVRSHPHDADQFRTNIHFFEGELVAIDLVRPSPNGTLLRLSDGCGWLFQQDGTEDAMKRVRTHAIYCLLGFYGAFSLSFLLRFFSLAYPLPSFLFPVVFLS